MCVITLDSFQECCSQKLHAWQIGNYICTSSYKLSSSSAVFEFWPQVVLATVHNVVVTILCEFVLVIVL